ncbi:MAG: translation initiation factor 2, partial [Acetobacteraceae bacterium]
MKPTFALDLTSEAIALLHRTPKGWLSIGEVAFDAPDLSEALDYLRKTALGLSPLGVATKLVLPNSQILYTEVHAPGPSREEKRRQIAAGLEGRTPYGVEDLVFDWSGKGATVKVAVIARETLEQAEAFASEHRLNPVSFVAVPEDGAFVGEPWFGPTSVAPSILAEDETVERDREPVSILRRELPKTEPLPPPEAPIVEAPPTPPEPATPPVAIETEDDPLPGLEEALNADLPLSGLPSPDPIESGPSDLDPVDLGPAKPDLPVSELAKLEPELARALADDADDLPPMPAPVAAPAAAPLVQDIATVTVTVAT